MSKLFNSTAEIYKNIVSEALIDSKGISWETLTSFNQKMYKKKIAYGILDGITGILFFLLEYMAKVPDNKEQKSTLEMINLSSNKVFDYYSKNPHLVGFYNGKAGFIFWLLQAYKQTGDKSFMTKTIALCTPLYKSSFYNLNIGSSGYLLALLHVYEETKNQQLTPIIKSITSQIIKGARLNENGIYWDESIDAMDACHGFLHGNAGIIFALQQVQKIYNAPDELQNIIDEAILWENDKINTDTLNWDDIYNEEMIMNIFNSPDAIDSKPKKEQLSKSINTFSWSSGSPGAFIPRLSKLNENYDQLKSVFKNQLQKNLDNKEPIFTINRLGGQILTAKLFSSTNYDLITEKINNQFLKNNYFFSGQEFNKEMIDISFFKGEAGIGYLLLKLNDFSTDSNVLFPFVKGLELSEKPILAINVNELIFHKYFTLSYTMQKEIESQKDILYFEKTKNYFDFFEKSDYGIKSDFRLRQKVFDMDKIKINPMYEYLKAYYNKNHPSRKTEYLIANENYAIIEMGVDNYYLLGRTFYGTKILDKRCNKLSDLIFSKAKSKITISILQQDVFNDYNKIGPKKSMIEGIDEKINNQIDYLISRGALEYTNV